MQFRVLWIALGLCWPSWAGESWAETFASRIHTISSKVTELRGLSLPAPAVIVAVPKSELQQVILKTMSDEYLPAELDEEALGLKRFGLIPVEMNWGALVARALSERSWVYYSHTDKVLYTAEGQGPGPGKNAALAGELVHVLQDQRWGLKALLRRSRFPNRDMTAAGRALLEGDSTALMFEYSLAGTGRVAPWGDRSFLQTRYNKLAGELKQIPLVLRARMEFSRVAGLRFVAHFRKHHPWSRIDAIYKLPPVSTEQILHPEKYERDELPQDVRDRLPRTLGNMRVKSPNIMGEKGLEVFLRTHHVDGEKARRAAAGWGGDRSIVYAPKGHRGSDPSNCIGVSLSTWDTVSDAAEFFEALEHALPHFAGAPRIQREDGILQFSSATIGSILAERRDSKVLLIVNAPDDGAGLQAELWKGWKVRPGKRRKFRPGANRLPKTSAGSP